MADVDPRDDPVGVRAARQVQLEIWTILGGFRALTVVGGSALPYIVQEPTGDPNVGARKRMRYSSPGVHQRRKK